MKRILLIVVFIICVGILWSGKLKNVINNPQKPSVSITLQSPTPARTSDIVRFANPSIDTIFSKDHSWTATLSGNPKVRTIIATGDVMPARTVNLKVTEYNDYLYPYYKTQEITQNADITFANLETPLFAGCKPTREGMTFCGSDKNVEGLKFAGIDVVNLANNHTGNYRETGLKETMKLLDESGISHTGTGFATIKEVHGKKIAFLGFSDVVGTCCGARLATTEAISQDIAQIRLEVDLVIVQFHWGPEYTEDPSREQRIFGKAAIDAGADLVIGNHAHWVQGIEFYKGKLITYAHGNFVFDQMWSTETRQGVVGKYTFYEDTLFDVEFLPTVIENFSQPRLAHEEENEIIIGRMIRSSKKLQAMQ